MKHPPESFPVDTERVPMTNGILAQGVLPIIAEMKEQFSKRPDLLRALSAMEELVKAGVETQTLCQVRKDLFALLGRKDKQAAIPFIRNGAQVIQDGIDVMRSTNGLRYPDEILTMEMQWCRGSPWYALFYNHDDPEQGTTGGPHILLARLPKPITAEGKDLSVKSVRSSGQMSGNHKPIVRIHSECFFGDFLKQIRCACGPQFTSALQAVEANGCGAVFYHRSEGRGMGLPEKAISLRIQEGRDQDGAWTGKVGTAQAMQQLGYEEPDMRQYPWIGNIFRGVGLHEFGLITNNTKKMDWLLDQNFAVHRVDAATEVLDDTSLIEILWKIADMQHADIQFENFENILRIHLDKLRKGEPIDELIKGHLVTILLKINANEADYICARLRREVMSISAFLPLQVPDKPSSPVAPKKKLKR